MQYLGRSSRASLETFPGGRKSRGAGQIWETTVGFGSGRAAAKPWGSASMQTASDSHCSGGQALSPPPSCPPRLSTCDQFLVARHE